MKNIVLVGGNIVERKGKVLLVKKVCGEDAKWKLPSGKLAMGEEILECAARKGFEETGYILKPEHLVGVYQYYFDAERNVVIFAFGSRIIGGELEPGEEILDAEWFGIPHIAELNQSGLLKTPYIYTAVSDYRKGKKVRLEAIKVLD